MNDRPVQTPDGRTLLVQEAGDPGGTPILFHNGTPCSRLLDPRDARLAERMGVRLLSYDRPGYGGSSRHEAHTVGDCAQDVRTIAAALEIDRLGVYGISGGGPHAIACAALLEDLVPAVGVLASEAPWGSEGLDFFAGTGELNVDDVKLFFADRAAARAKTEADRLEFLDADPAGVAEAMQSLLSPVDAAVFSGDLADYLVTAMRVGLEPGPDGWWDDGVALLGPWGFDLTAITTPVLLLHGRHDRFVPFAHGEWLAAHIPGCDAHLSEDDGHLTLLPNHLHEVYAWLLDRL